MQTEAVSCQDTLASVVTQPPKVELSRAEAPEAVEVIKASADLADQIVRHRFSLVAEERLLALVHDTAMLAKIGRAMALLSHIVTRCAELDQCVVNLHETALEIGQPYSTVKSWLTALEEAGLVTKTSQGRDGVKIELNTARVTRMPVFEQIAGAFQAAVQLLQAVQTTMNGVLSHAASTVSRWAEALRC